MLAPVPPLPWLRDRRFSCAVDMGVAELPSRRPVTCFTANGPRMRTLAARGFVFLRSEVGETAAWQPGIFDKSVASGQWIEMLLLRRGIMAPKLLQQKKMLVSLWGSIRCRENSWKVMILKNRGGGVHRYRGSKDRG